MGMELTLPILFGLAFALGAAVRRRFVVVVAFLCWPAMAAGTAAGIWGTHAGDGLVWGAVVGAVATTGGALGGVLVGRAVTLRAAKD
jgi:hypothetical protein